MINPRASKRSGTQAAGFHRYPLPHMDAVGWHMWRIVGGQIIAMECVITHLEMECHRSPSMKLREARRAFREACFRSRLRGLA